MTITKKAQGKVVIFSLVVLAKESVHVLLAFDIFLIIKVMDRRAEVAIMVD